MTWTEEQDELLKTHHTAGLSASQSAGLLGCTRNAVIGKWARMKLPPRRPVAPPQPRPRPYAHGASILPRNKSAQRKRSHETRQAEQRFSPESVISTDDIPRQQRRTLLDLGERHCRWPCGDPGTPDFFFCGGIRKDAGKPIGNGGLPYCDTHCQAAYVPAPRRRTPYVYRGPQI